MTCPSFQRKIFRVHIKLIVFKCVNCAKVRTDNTECFAKPPCLILFSKLGKLPCPNFFSEITLNIRKNTVSELVFDIERRADRSILRSKPQSTAVMRTLIISDDDFPIPYNPHRPSSTELCIASRWARKCPLLWTSSHAQE